MGGLSVFDSYDLTVIHISILIVIDIVTDRVGRLFHSIESPFFDSVGSSQELVLNASRVGPVRIGNFNETLAGCRCIDAFEYHQVWTVVFDVY